MLSSPSVKVVKLLLVLETSCEDQLEDFRVPAGPCMAGGISVTKYGFAHLNDEYRLVDGKLGFPIREAAELVWVFVIGTLPFLHVG